MVTNGSKDPVLLLSDDVLHIDAGPCAAPVPARATPDTIGHDKIKASLKA